MNIRKVIIEPIILPRSLTIPFNREKIKPNPSVNNIIGIGNIKINKIYIDGL
jgi:hypothetical protein